VEFRVRPQVPEMKILSVVRQPWPGLYLQLGFPHPVPFLSSSAFAFCLPACVFLVRLRLSVSPVTHTDRAKLESRPE
jgi:hypothetical protein